MSHVINSNQPYSFKQVAQVTIVNYATGGESFTAAEFGYSTTGAVLFMLCDSTSNSLGALLIPILVAGKVKLINAANLQEVPPTAALNANITALICGN